jgi:hypothetical protein
MPRNTANATDSELDANLKRVQTYLSQEMLAFLHEGARLAGTSWQEYLRHLITAAMEADKRHRSVAGLLESLIGEARGPIP